MTPSIGKKLSLFTAVLVALSAIAVGYVGYLTLENKVAQILRKDTLDSATLLSSRVRNELRHVAEKGRILAAAALEEFKNSDDQYRFLEENLSMDDQFVAMTLYRRSPATQGHWVSVFRLTRAEADPNHLGEADFKQLDLKYPLDFARVSEGAVDVSVGSLKDNMPILRLAVPIVKKPGQGFTQILGIEVRQERLTAAFAEATALFSFILDRHGRLISQTDPTHFTLGEDLSYLPVLQMANSTEAPNGNLDYFELPGAPLQYAAFHKVGYADLTIVTQAPRSHVIKILRTYTRQAGLVGIACVFLAMALSLLAAWGILGSRLKRIAATLGRIGDGKFLANFVDRHSDDEVGEFAAKLQAVCDQLKDRDKAHATYAKLKTRKAKSQMAEGKINLKGERTKAIVLHCHLRGMEKVIAKADAEILIQILNDFSQSITKLVEESQGIIDHIHGGSVIAYWGVPSSEKDDMDHAISTAIDIRKLAKNLNQAFKEHHLPEISLAMGLDYGTVIVGQMGSQDRLEYTALGQALEVASRIQSFSDQFGTDFLLTRQAIDLAPKWYSVEQVSAGDENSPELFELVAVSAHARQKKSKVVELADTTPLEPSGEPSAETTGDAAPEDAPDEAVASAPETAIDTAEEPETETEEEAA